MGTKLFYPKGSSTSIFTQWTREKIVLMLSPPQLGWKKVHFIVHEEATWVELVVTSVQQLQVVNRIISESISEWVIHLYFFWRKRGVQWKNKSKHKEHFYHITSGQAQDSDLLWKGQCLMQKASANTATSATRAVALLGSKKCWGYAAPLKKKA